MGKAPGGWQQPGGEGGHGCAPEEEEEVREAKGEKENLGSQNQAGRAQGLADGAAKRS